jgi:hypothetical protein
MRKQQWCDASFVNEAPRDPDKRNLAAAQVAVDACFASADYVEGRTAFIENENPLFAAGNTQGNAIASSPGS